MPGRTPLIAGNWKMFKTVREATEFARALPGLVADDLGAVDVVVAPVFTAVQAVAEALTGSRIGVAAQDLHWEKEGAFTGEVSAGMIKEAGASHVIIGHSERRRLFGETDMTVNKKLAAAMAEGLTPIVCVGETLEERERGEMLSVLDRQMKGGLDRVAPDRIGALIVAYEPVWAIGTGRNATAAQAQEAHLHIRSRLKEWFGTDGAGRCRILYGGSVKPENAAELVREPDVDGALVGGASLDVKGFSDIVRRSRAATV